MGSARLWRKMPSVEAARLQGRSRADDAHGMLKRGEVTVAYCWTSPGQEVKKDPHAQLRSPGASGSSSWTSSSSGSEVPLGRPAGAAGRQFAIDRPALSEAENARRVEPRNFIPRASSSRSRSSPPV